MASAGNGSTNPGATPHPADQQPDRITLAKGLTSQVILEILGMILAERSLQEVLTSVVRVVEAQREDEGMLCSVWLLDQDGAHMRAIAAPTLPESYIAALDGFAVGSEGGSCGAAVNRREPVFVSDVLTDPILERVRDVIAAHGIRACWSAPIISHQGEILGTFAFYFRFVRVPHPGDMQLIDGASRIAAIAIERKRAVDGRQRAEDAVRESQRELSLIIDNIPAYVWCASTDGQLTYINKRLSEYVGRPLDSLWGNGWLDSVHPDDRTAALDTWRRCVATGTPLENQYRLRRADGVYRWFHVPRQLRHTSDGQPTLWYGLLIDIEERKRAEQALAVQNTRLQLLLQLTKRITSNLELRELLRLISANVRNLMQADAAGVAFFDEASNKSRIYAVDFPDAKGFVKEEIVVTPGLAFRRAWESRKPVIVKANDREELGPEIYGLVVAEGLNGHCLIPLTSHGRTVGVLIVARKLADSFTSEDVDFLSEASGQIAIAIENCLAYGEIFELKEKLAQEKL
ncbi:MAG TPA: GAF domain-containing protein, partial [Terriglobales bacterium]|nr:GAF domain-containing protein [Terriglobales bacterium]